MTPKNVQMPNPNPKYKPPGTPAGGRGGNLMEIEKLIKHMREEAQDYRSGRTLGRAFADAEDVLDEAATALEQLQAENDRLRRERDAALESLPHECKSCRYYEIFFNGCTPDYNCTNPDGYCSNNYDRWQWRGMEEE